jgi:hypothetical protein
MVMLLMVLSTVVALLSSAMITEQAILNPE